MSTEPIRVAICGLGMVAQAVYVPLLLRRPESFQISAVVDLSDERRDAMADRLRIGPADRFATVDDLIAAEAADAALLLTSGSHGAEARALLDADIAVLCEKPLAYTLAEAKRLEGADRLLLGYMKLFDPAVEAAATAISDIGAIRGVEVTVLHPSPERQLHHLGGPSFLPGTPPPTALQSLDKVDLQRRNEALGPDAGDGISKLYSNVILGSVVHDLAVTRVLAGAPTEVRHADWWDTAEGGRSVSFDALLPGGGRMTLFWHLLPDYPSYREEVRIHGEYGSISLAFPAPYLMNAPTELEIRLTDGDDQRVIRPQSYAEAFDRELTHFLAVARDHERPRVTAADGAADIRTSQRIARAVAASQGVELGGEAATA